MLPSEHPLSDPDEEEEEEEEEETVKKKKKKKSCKRRFSEEQVRSLETIFASETKIEPKKKVQVAKELGLQPKQVAVWFQNKRARWKSKQIETNYRLLKAKYDALKARFHTMKLDKQSLLNQLQELQSLLVEQSNKSEYSDCKDNSAVLIGAELPVKSDNLQEEVDHQGIIYSDDDKSGGNMAYLGHDMQFNQDMDSSSIKWCNFDAGNFYHESSTTSYLWDSWT